MEELPIIEKLPNGLRVVIWPQRHLHSAGIGLYVRTGSRFDPPQYKGLSHFLEHIIFRGNKKYPNSFELNKTFEGYGGSLNAYTTREYTFFFGKFRPSFWREALTFFADLLDEPTFSDLEKERQIILEERLEDIDRNGQLINEDDISRMAIWGDHPMGYPIIGTPKGIKSIGVEELKAHFERFYCAPNMLLCLTGKIDPDESFPVIRELYSRFSSGQLMVPPPLPEGGPSDEKLSFIYHDSSQVSLLLTALIPPPTSEDFLPLLFIDRLLDDGMSSRLWQSAVEREGLCYDIYSSVSAYSDISYFDIGASIAPQKLPALLELIFRELRVLSEVPIGEEEMRHFKNRWKFKREYILDHIFSFNEYLGGNILYDTYTPMSEQFRIVDSMSAGDIQRCAQKYLRPSNFYITAIGPLNRSIKQKVREIVSGEKIKKEMQ